MRKPAPPPDAKRSNVQAEGRCACGAVRFEIDVPAVWAWHDHGEASRRALGGAYATYVGSWKSRFHWMAGEDALTRYQDPETRPPRGFGGRCGSPVLCERARSPKMVNIPRGMFRGRTGREPRYHLNLGEQADWTYLGEPLGPLKGYHGVMWTRPKRKPRGPSVDDFL